MVVVGSYALHGGFNYDRTMGPIAATGVARFENKVYQEGWGSVRYLKVVASLFVGCSILGLI